MDFGLGGIGWVAWGVLLTLFVMSVLSFAIVVERAWWMRRARRSSRSCSQAVATLLRAGRVEAALQAARDAIATGAHVAPVLAAGLGAWRRAVDREGVLEARDATHAAGSHAVLDLADEMRRGLATLATVASTAPFVGLFGTTFGIMHAFEAMSKTGNAGMASISAGIAEALITTAFGLVVAIPALWAHNAIADRAGRLEREAERVARELADGLAAQAA
jgi:biopolymer transport protein ExbB/TolQ